MRAFCLILIAVFSLAAATDESVRRIVRRSCMGCHAGVGAKGGVNLAGGTISPSVWHKVGQIVEAGQMPPHGAPQPTAAEREALVEWIGKTLSEDRYRQPGPRLMRRLTRLEYNNTVRDLLELDRDLFMFPERLPYTKSYFQPASASLGRQLTVEGIEYGQKIPVLLRYSSLLADNRAEYGFTNRGDALNVSPLLMEKYLSVASEIASSPELTKHSATARLLLQPQWWPAASRSRAQTTGGVSTPRLPASGIGGGSRRPPASFRFGHIARRDL